MGLRRQLGAIVQKIGHEFSGILHRKAQRHDLVIPALDSVPHTTALRAWIL